MAVRRIVTRLAVDGETEYRKEMASVNSALKTVKSELQYTEAAFRGQANTVEALTAKDQLLRKEIEQQQEKVKALEQAVSDASEAYGENDKRTYDWKQSLNRARTELIHMNGELSDTERYLEEAGKSASGCASSIDGFGKEVKDAGEDLDDMGGGFGGFVEAFDKLKGVVAGGAVAVGVNELKDAILGVVESTEEYRKIMGTLETSSQAAGYSAEETAQAYDRLYGVLGDTQTAATTTANLQAISLEQENLMALVDICIGSWAKYGDSIPIDGLAEAINETIRCGEVTGSLADVLNWGSQEGERFGVIMRESTEANEEWNNSVADAKTAEDYFNLALQECQTQAERADLILQTLAAQGLADTANAWVQNNADIVAMNQATSELDAAMGRLGEMLSPLAAKLVSFGADALEFVIGKVKSTVEWFKNLNATLNAQGEARRLAGIEEYNARMEVDGSHASGLWRVPYDGYVAELHANERILTAAQADAYDAERSRGSAGSDITSAEVYPLGFFQGETRPIEINVTLELDGDALARKQLKYNEKYQQLAGTSLIN